MAGRIATQWKAEVQSFCVSPTSTATILNSSDCKMDYSAEVRRSAFKKPLKGILKTSSSLLGGADTDFNADPCSNQGKGRLNTIGCFPETQARREQVSRHVPGEPETVHKRCVSFSAFNRWDNNSSSNNFNIPEKPSRSYTAVPSLSLSQCSLMKARQSANTAQQQNHIWSTVRPQCDVNQAPTKPKRRGNTALLSDPLLKPRRRDTNENMFQRSVDAFLMNAAASQPPQQSVRGMGPPPSRRMSNE